MQFELTSADPDVAAAAAAGTAGLRAKRAEIDRLLAIAEALEGAPPPPAPAGFGATPTPPRPTPHPGRRKAVFPSGRATTALKLVSYFVKTGNKPATPHQIAIGAGLPLPATACLYNKKGVFMKVGRAPRQFGRPQSFLWKMTGIAYHKAVRDKIPAGR